MGVGGVGGVYDPTKEVGLGTEEAVSIQHDTPDEPILISTVQTASASDPVLLLVQHVRHPIAEEGEAVCVEPDVARCTVCGGGNKGASKSIAWCHANDVITPQRGNI
jgi:hypothetical protein